MEQNKFLIVLVTTNSEQSATLIAENVVKSKLVACANIIPKIKSIYVWEENLQNDEEVLMIFKTSEANYSELELKIKELHEYDVPEIIAIPIVHGSNDYLTWVATNTQRGNNA